MENIPTNNMENIEKNIGIEEIRNIKMTSEEKRYILESILSLPIPATKPTHSPYFLKSMFQKNYFAYYGTLSLLIITLSGGGIAFGAQESLPGDFLYTFKVKFLEPINYAFKLSPETKAEYHISLARERLVEAETLARQGKLDEYKEEQLVDLLAIHTINLNENINQLNQNKSDDKAQDIVTSFRAEMSAHAKVLDLITEKITKDEEQENTNISETARTNADNLRNSFQENKVGKINEYKKNKDSIESIIDSTESSLYQVDKEISPIQQKVIDDTLETLDASKYFLNEADQQNDTGDFEKAYSLMLDSESSAKEADIFLKTGLELGEIEN